METSDLCYTPNKILCKFVFDIKLYQVINLGQSVGCGCDMGQKKHSLIYLQVLNVHEQR